MSRGYATGVLEYSDDPVGTPHSSIANPDFETGITGWTENDGTTAATLTPSHDTTITHGGSAGSLKLVNTTANEDDFMEMNPPFAVDTHYSYTVSAWVYVQSYTGAAILNRGLFVWEGGGLGTSVNVAMSGGLLNEWQYLEVEWQPTAAGVDGLRLYAPQGTVYWDDVNIIEWKDRSSFLVGDVSWSDGKSRDLDDPQAGSMQFRLDSTNGEWFPLSSGSLYPDSPFLLRRFRWTVNDTPMGIWYPTRWDVGYPTRRDNRIEVDVSCVDGFELLSLDALELLSPSTASTYEEVVMHDAPWGYWRLGDKFGTKMTATAGPDGTYHGLPTLGSVGHITGDPDTAVTFSAFTLEYARAPVEQANQFSDPNAITVEAWIQLNDDTADSAFVTGPVNTINGPIFALYYNQLTSDFVFEIMQTSGVTTSTVWSPSPLAGVLYHLVGTWDGAHVKLYGNSVLRSTGATASLPMITAPAGESVRISRWGATALYSHARIDEVAVYEHALSAERILAHYEAGTERGIEEQTAGERVEAVATSDIFGNDNIQAGEFTVKAIMEHGQSKLDEIRAAVKAEMPDSQFYFGGDGHPVYLGWNYKGSSPYNTVQGTFGNGPGEIPSQDIVLVYDDEMFNTVTIGHESAPGEETQHEAVDETWREQFRRRAHAETGLILTEHHEAIAVAAAILEKHKSPQMRVASLTVNGKNTLARAQILGREIGDLIRVKGLGGTPDVITTILGRSFLLTAGGHLVCTWNVGRGLDASADVWYLGITGYTELGTGTVLG